MSERRAVAAPDGLRFELEPPLARIVIDRDGKRNAVSLPMLEAMRLFVDEIAGNDEVRALVLAGEGRGFCAGEDVRGFDFPDVETAERFLAGPLDLFVALERLPKPLVVAVHGFAFGFGSEVLLVADSVHAAPGTVLGFAEIDHGLVPSVLVTRGLDVAFRRRVLDLALTGRRIGVEEALGARIIHEIVDDPRAAAEAAALEMAEWSPESVALVKGMLGSGAVDDHARALEFMPPVLIQVSVAI
jgi:enoyl-CoA hydratase